VSQRLVVVHPDFDALAQGTAARLLLRLMDTQSVRRPVHLGLGGGPAVAAVLAAMTESPLLSAVDWTGVHVWWVADRSLPNGDPQRNETQARDALLSSLLSRGWLTEKQIHALPELLDSGRDLPVFDLVVLGLNPTEPGTDWVCLDPSAVSSAQQLWVLAAGRENAEHAAGILAGDLEGCDDAAGVGLCAQTRGRDLTLWLLDTAAADAE